jgi:hypothetical protein
LYAWLELVLKKMLDQNEQLDPESVQTIRDELIALYYGGVVERLRQLQFMAAYRNLKKIRRMGQSYRTISHTLLVRAGRKLANAMASSSNL